MILKPANTIFFGTPQFSADILKFIINHLSSTIKIQAVVTQPDRPQGRSQTISPSPIAQLATEYHLPVFKPEKLDTNNLIHLKLLEPRLFIVVSYGQIIPQNWLDLPSVAPINIHFSLLPKYRGALCISETLKNGDSETGVTIIQMDADLDHGPIISQIKEKVDIEDNLETLTKKLTQKTQLLLETTLPDFINQKITPTPQNHQQATFTPFTKTRTRQSAFIPWKDIFRALSGTKSLSTHNLIRSLNPDPGAWTEYPNLEQPLKIIQTTYQDQKLIITKVQLPGKNPISWYQFLQGHPLPNKT